MSMIRRSQTVITAFTGVLACALVVLVAVTAGHQIITAEDQVAAQAPIADPSGDAASGDALGTSQTDSRFINYTVDAGKEQPPIH